MLLEYVRSHHICCRRLIGASRLVAGSVTLTRSRLVVGGDSHYLYSLTILAKYSHLYIYIYYIYTIYILYIYTIFILYLYVMFYNHVIYIK